MFGIEALSAVDPHVPEGTEWTVRIARYLLPDWCPERSRGRPTDYLILDHCNQLHNVAE